jgi:pSer/pThr/pTyr-binding forkhead associated (FHA) protein
MAAIVQLNKGVAVKKFEIKKPLIRIGRRDDNDIFIDDKVVSTEHAVIEMVEEKGQNAYYIRDLESTNNTFVNGEPISKVRLQNEDMIRIGWVIFKFVDSIDEKLEKTLKIHKSWIPGVYYTKE